MKSPAVRQLRQPPWIGRERKDLSPPGIPTWRVAGFPRWLVFYTVNPKNQVVLFRVRQGMMNLVVLKLDS